MRFPARAGRRLPAAGCWFVGAALGVEAGIGEQKALDWTAVDEVLTDNLVNIFRVDEAVPDGVRIDDHYGAVLALVETAGFVGADFAFQPGVLDCVLEGPFQLAAAVAGTAGTGGVLVPLVGADEEMMLELCHSKVSFRAGRGVSGCCAAQTGF
jgi:hypothetical protein